jgi:Icc-related predicted phosphoesterase
MKILTVSDDVSRIVYSPQIKERFKDVELVLSCGDLPLYYLEYIVTLLNVPLYYVMGNHMHDVAWNGNGHVKVYPGGCVNIDNKVVEYKGLIIAGLEGSMRYNRQEYQYTELDMSLKIIRLKPRLTFNRLFKKRAIDILITHAPPYHIHDDEDLCHRGFKVFLKFMDAYQPRYLIHGHKHVYDPNEITETLYNKTRVINTYGYKVIEIEKTQNSDGSREDDKQFKWAFKGNRE